jgi:hypothetical protein
MNGNPTFTLYRELISQEAVPIAAENRADGEGPDPQADADRSIAVANQLRAR